MAVINTIFLSGGCITYGRTATRFQNLDCSIMNRVRVGSQLDFLTTMYLQLLPEASKRVEGGGK